MLQFSKKLMLHEMQFLPYFSHSWLQALDCSGPPAFLSTCILILLNQVDHHVMCLVMCVSIRYILSPPSYKNTHSGLLSRIPKALASHINALPLGRRFSRGTPSSDTNKQFCCSVRQAFAGAPNHPWQETWEQSWL